MNYVPLYKELKTERDDCFFIGLNTAEGFRLADTDLFSEKKLKRLFIIKGAAGSGKSTMIKKVADACSYEGYQITRFICSSDPSSYDGILIDGRIGLVDGTAPHTVEMIYPGASSELINLANFWDTKKLKGSRETVIELSENKRLMFDKAYRALNVIKTITDGINRDSQWITDADKIEKTIRRLIKPFRKEQLSVQRKKRIIKSFGMRGSISLDTFKKSAASVFYVKDRFGTSYRFIETLAEILYSEDIEFYFSPDPIFCGRVSDIFIPKDGVLITNSEYLTPVKTINMDRFIVPQRLSNVKGSLKLAQKCKDQLISDAEKHLNEAGEYHFSLESIYKETMNFDAVNEYTKLLTRNILCEL